MINWQKVSPLLLIKYLLLLFVCIQLNLLADSRPNIEHFDKNNKVFEFLANNMNMENDIIKGEGNVTLITPSYFISADFALYNPAQKEIEIMGNVHIFKDETLYLEAEKVKIAFDDNYALLEPFYFQESQTGIWIAAKNAQIKKDEYILENSLFSSCGVELPIWDIVFSEGSYNSEESWLKLWHARLRIFKQPILYVPYASFSLNKKRKTGFLYPSFKDSSNDGFVWTQPFYLAIDEQWDATFTGMLRTKRGYGGEIEFRFADDRNQIFEISGGYFDVKKDYQKQYNLVNDHYSGYQVQYVRYDFLKDYIRYFNEDGFYIDWAGVNDIEYLRLREKGESGLDIYDSLLTSRINYFLKGKNDYLGLYSKYYIDLSQIDNANTLQTLPTLQYHIHNSPFFVKYLNYSFDYRLNDYWRQDGYSILQHEATLPISYTQSFFDDYAIFRLSSTFYASKANYYSRDYEYDSWLHNGLFYGNYYTISLFSDLVKPYDDFLHSMHFEVGYTLDGLSKEHGIFDWSLVLPNIQERLNMNFSQYYNFYNSDAWILHRLSQPIYFDDYLLEYGDFENEVNWILNRNWTLTSSMFYSFLKNRIAEVSHDISYNSDVLALYFGHFYRKKNTRFLETYFDANEANFIHLGATKKFNFFDLFGSIGYDYKENYFRTWNVGIQKDIRCFSYRFRVASETRPILTTSGIRPQDNHYMLLEFRLLPLVTVPYKHNMRG